MSEIDYSSFLGREERRTEAIEAGPAIRLALALDFDDAPVGAGDALPNGWHWLMFPEAERASFYTADGRGTRAGLLPDFAGLARMWAGGAFTFQRPLRIGQTIVRQSRVTAIAPKSGRSGRLVVASVEHRLMGPTGEAVSERQDLVFREPKPYAGAAEGERAALSPTWRRTIVPDEVLLFRISALTYNSHRIHYDLRYAAELEGYPGLLVHGPLSCLLLLDLIRRQVADKVLAQFEYRALRPLFCGNPLSVCGALTADDRIATWIEDHEGYVAMRGSGGLG